MASGRLVVVRAVDDPAALLLVTSRELKRAMNSAIARETTIWLKGPANPWPARPGARRRAGRVGVRKYRGLARQGTKSWDKASDKQPLNVRSGNSKTKFATLQPKGKNKPRFSIINKAVAEDGFAYVQRLETKNRALRSKQPNPYYRQILYSYMRDRSEIGKLALRRAEYALAAKLRKQQAKAAA